MRTPQVKIAIVLIVGVVIFLIAKKIWTARQEADKIASQTPPPPPLLRFEAVQVIPAQTVITKEMVREYQVKDADKPAQGQPVPSEWITKLDDIVWHVTRQNIALGAKLERGMLAGKVGDAGLGALIGYGRRAMTIPITRESSQMTQYMVRPGERVDIIATFKDDKYAKTIVEDVPVIAADVYVVGRDKENGNLAQRGPYVPSAPRPTAAPVDPKTGQPLQQTAPPAEGKAAPAAQPAAQPEPAAGADGKAAGPPPGPKSPDVPPPKQNMLTVGVTPEQAETLAIAIAYGELDVIVRGREEGVPVSAVSPTVRRGMELTDISPYLGKTKRAATFVGEGRKFPRPAGRILPRAPRRAPRVTLLPTPARPVQTTPIVEKSARAVGNEGEVEKAGHKIEVYSPSGVRVVEVPREN